jgi:hypothetical protein
LGVAVVQEKRPLFTRAPVLDYPALTIGENLNPTSAVSRLAVYHIDDLKNIAFKKFRRL